MSEIGVVENHVELRLYVVGEKRWGTKQEVSLVLKISPYSLCTFDSASRNVS